MAKGNLTTRAAFCPASSVRLSLLLMLQSNAIGFALPLALELYRKLLRNARHLPDPVVRSYVFYQTKRLFRERQFEFGRQKLNNYFKQGGYALRVVRRAVGGDTKAFGKLVALAYCIKGSGKHDLGIQEWEKDSQKRKSSKKHAKSLVGEPILLPEPLQRVIEKQVATLPRSLRRVYRHVIGFDDVLVRIKHKNQSERNVAIYSEAPVSKVGELGNLHIFREERLPEQFVYERTIYAHGRDKIQQFSRQIKKIPPWLIPFF